MVTIEHFNQEFHEHLDDDFEVLFAADSPPSLTAIAEFQKAIQCHFPADFVCFISHYCNGFYAEAHESIWPRKKGGAYWMFQYGLLVYGLDAGLPDWTNLRTKVFEFRTETGTDLTPCMKTISSADPYCFTADGTLVKWNHEIAQPIKLKESFFEAFVTELSHLRANKERAKKELVH